MSQSPLTPIIFLKSIKFSKHQHAARRILSNFVHVSNIRKFHQIPSTKKGKFLSTFDLILNGGPNYLHEHCEKRHKQLGPIYREHLGPIELIFLADTSLIKTVLANEGPHPHHNVPQAWLYYNEVHRLERGLFFQTGEPWVKIRRAFNKVMLTDFQRITRFSKQILSINDDLLSSWAKNISGDSIIVQNVKPDLCRWSIESVGLILFGDRMGCVPSDTLESLPDELNRAETLVKSVAAMFHETSKFQILPVKLAHKLNLTSWQNFSSASSKMLLLSNHYARDNIKKIRMHKNVSITKDLIDLGQLSDEEICRSLVDLIIAAADTTSNSLQWMLYLLAKHNEVQSKLLGEADKVLKCKGSSYKLDDLNEQAPYLKAFMKEVHRLYPTAPFLARTLDREIQLGPYKIGPGRPFVFSLYSTSRSSQYFREPLKFDPERWFRNQQDNQIRVEKQADDQTDGKCPMIDKRAHAYASLPFGLGARMCIGRRAAELQMGLFLLSFVTKFESSILDEDLDIGIKLQMILSPDKPIRLKLKIRSN